MFVRAILPTSLLFLATSQALPTEDCPILGPALPSNFDVSNTAAFRSTISTFRESIESLFSAGAVNRTHTSFAIDVFSTHAERSIYSFYHEAPGLNGSLTAGAFDDKTVSRLGSVSKLITAYALIAHSGLEILDEPVTKYLPELAGNDLDKPLDHIVWENITIGALASHQGGTGGFRYATLGLVLAKITGLPFAEALQNILTEPLGLKGTLTKAPDGDFNGLVVPGGINFSSWGQDYQLTSPTGGIYSNPSDLRTVGLSILQSRLLSPASTRAWMKPRGHTAALTTSVGAPWEIERLALPVSPNSTQTRISDLYTKLGGNTGYSAVFALSPDHGIGFSILLAGPKSIADRIPLRDTVGKAFVTAAEHAALENAAKNLAGTFADASSAGTNLTLTVDKDRPGLGLKDLFVDNVDWRVGILNYGLPEPAGEGASLRLYPTNSDPAPRAFSTCGGEKSEKISFRVYGAGGLELEPLQPPAAVEGGSGLFNDGYTAWQQVGFYPNDEMVLEIVNGRLESVTSIGANRTMRRVD
ncbi:MAG: hypothetical protein M1820_009608 [Bogoriella megaspora]|nr:MAG: hypothetical protein M1820_009608 [Bogoriella megaspora]